VGCVNTGRRTEMAYCERGKSTTFIMKRAMSGERCWSCVVEVKAETFVFPHRVKKAYAPCNQCVFWKEED
jgi:hypothetical protein